MNLFQYLDAHPWWALVYLAAGLTGARECLRMVVAFVVAVRVRR